MRLSSGPSSSCSHSSLYELVDPSVSEPRSLARLAWARRRTWDGLARNFSPAALWSSIVRMSAEVSGGVTSTAEHVDVLHQRSLALQPVPLDVGSRYRQLWVVSDVSKVPECLHDRVDVLVRLLRRVPLNGEC